jgi:hypothetical protein
MTLNGEVIISFWVSTTKDGGLCLGPRVKGYGLHHIAWEKDGKFRYHIRHKGIEEPSDESPIGGQKSTKVVIDKMLKMLEKRRQCYHGNRTCWVFTPTRWERIKVILPRMDEKGDLIVPLEISFAGLDMDFSKTGLWRKVRIRQLPNIEPHFGFIETRGGIRLIVPISKNEMLAWPLSKADEMQRYFMRAIGFDEFADYLKDTDEGEKFFKTARERIKQLLGSWECFHVFVSRTS